MSKRKHRLVDCRPQWVKDGYGIARYLRFDCPEGHDGCVHIVPFTPALNGTAKDLQIAQWKRSGNTFETVTLTPSIARHPRYKNREEALKDGCIAEHVNEKLLCAMHVNLINGTFHFANDSH